MISRFSGTVVWLALTVFFVAACGQGGRTEEGVGVRHPLIDSGFVIPDYAAAAIEASGGRQAWTRAEKLALTCVVTFYREDGSFYLTEQRHEIHPLLNSIRISGKEPQGELVWRLSAEGLCSISEGVAVADTSPQVNCSIAHAVLSVTTAAMRLSGRGTRLARGSQPVRIEGLWYYPIERGGTEEMQAGSPRPEGIFYQNAENFLVDTIYFRDPSMVVRGYDYKEVEKGGVLVPTKIEVFKSDRGGVLRERLAKIDYYRPG
ncbi:MAG TPA: hypothetical protein VMW16_07180 [Sedimentisphaerales bacterium]|nr:hypothetical protein [Sedimentisphaerales bacterium]